MARRGFSILLGFMLALGAAGAASAQVRSMPRGECTLMLDQSLSMAGYYGANPAKIVELIDNLAAPCGESMVVGKGALFTTAPLSGLRPSRPFGEDTWLGKGLGKWLSESSARRLIIVTDNVADNRAGSAQGDEQALFYRLLKAEESRLSHISIAILRLPFTGLVYSLDDRIKTKHDGYRALTIYVVERRGRRGDESFLGRVEEAIGRTGYTRYGGAGEPQRSEYAVARLSPFESGIDADAAGVSVKPEKGGRNVRIDDSKKVITVGRGASDGETRFAVHQVRVSTGPEWDFGDAPFQAGTAFPPSQKFGAALNAPCRVEPPRSTPGLNRQVTLSLLCAIPPATAGMTGEQRDRLVLGGRDVRKGELFLAIEARRGTLSLKGALQRYFEMSEAAERNPLGLASSSADVQERVYRLSELLDSAIPPSERVVVIKRFGLQTELGASGTSLLLRWLLAALPYLLAAAVLAGLLWWLSRPVTYKVGGAPQTDRLKLGFGSPVQLGSADGTRVRLTLWGPFVAATVGPARRILGRSGGAVRDAGGKVAVMLVPEGSAKGGRIGAQRTPGRRDPRSKMLR